MGRLRVGIIAMLLSIPLGSIVLVILAGLAARRVRVDLLIGLGKCDGRLVMLHKKGAIGAFREF